MKLLYFLASQTVQFSKEKVVNHADATNHVRLFQTWARQLKKMVKAQDWIRDVLYADGQQALNHNLSTARISKFPNLCW